MNNCTQDCNQGRTCTCTKLEQRNGGGSASNFMPVEMYEDSGNAISWALLAIAAICIGLSIYMAVTR